ncbi:hypothetical protein [Myroides sp. LJL110]
MMNDSLFKLLQLELIDSPNRPIIGILLAFNESWILIKTNSVDYLMDGYRLINRQVIKSISKDAHIRFTEQVLKAKAVNFKDSPIRLQEDIFETLKYITNKYGAFSIEFKNDSCCYVGRYIGHDDQNFFGFEELAPNGDWIEEIDEFDINKVNAIEFDTDYVESLVMFAYKKVNG